MSNHWWMHGAHAAAHSKGKGGAIALIVIGFFFAPMLIGIPLLIWGLIKLFSKE
jgi:hypothetical protein